jgi:hypothetical protein
LSVEKDEDEDDTDVFTLRQKDGEQSDPPLTSRGTDDLDGDDGKAKGPVPEDQPHAAVDARDAPDVPEPPQQGPEEMPQVRPPSQPPPCQVVIPPVSQNDATQPTRQSTRESRQTEFYGNPQLFMISSEPSSYSEMMKRPDRDRWLEAQESEFKSLVINKTYSVVDRPSNKPVVRSMWIYKVKVNPDNSERAKVRVVALGNTQTYGVDFEETFAPVVRAECINFILSFAVEKDFQIHHMDVETAFLNGSLKEEIFMEIPEGLDKPKGKVWKLNKSLYGLKQSPRCWNERFTKYLLSQGMSQSDQDPCLFLKKNEKGETVLIIAVYVDDTIITGTPSEIDRAKKFLNSEFRMKDLGELKLLLGIEIERTKTQLKATQQRYIASVLERFGMKDCNPASTPMIKQDDDEKSPLFADHTLFRQAIGSLAYVSNHTRPDITFAVNQAARKMQNPTDQD